MVLYNFHAEAEEEVSVAAGERVKVHYDMGDWLHVGTAAGTGRGRMGREGRGHSSRCGGGRGSCFVFYPIPHLLYHECGGEGWGHFPAPLHSFFSVKDIFFITILDYFLQMVVN